MTPDQLPVEHHDLRAHGTRLHYVTHGAGPAVVLLHGFPETWWTWRYQIAPLARAGFRVVAPDLRGYGASDRAGPYDLDTLAGDLEALIDAAGDGAPVRLVGHDWGGALAWHFAATRPSRCARLAVINCPHPVMMRRALLGRPSQLRRSWYMFFFQLPWLPEKLLGRRDGDALRRMYGAMARDRSHFGPDELRPMLDAALAPGALRSMVGIYRANMLGALRDPRMRASEQYPRIDAPTLLLWGLEDRALGFDDLVPGTERYAPRLRTETVPSAGHFVHAERPERVNPALLEFLRGWGRS